MADAAGETMASDTAGGAGEGAAASEENMPISPLTGSRTREYKVSLIVDYRKRLEDLDTQILKMREEETDSNVYSIKTSAETELKLWEGELNSIYNALMEMLSQEDAAKLASEQQEWLKNRDARAAESSGRNSGSMEGISYAATLASLTRDRLMNWQDAMRKPTGCSMKRRILLNRHRRNRRKYGKNGPYDRNQELRERGKNNGKSLVFPLFFVKTVLIII